MSWTAFAVSTMEPSAQAAYSFGCQGLVQCKQGVGQTQALGCCQTRKIKKEARKPVNWYLKARYNSSAFQGATVPETSSKQGSRQYRTARTASSSVDRRSPAWWWRPKAVFYASIRYASGGPRSLFPLCFCFSYFLTVGRELQWALRGQQVDLLRLNQQQLTVIMAARAPSQRAA